MNVCNRCENRRITRSTSNKPTQLARYYCSNCQQNFCEKCKTSHKLRNKSHEVATNEEFKSGKVDDDRETSSTNPEGGSWKFQYAFSTSEAFKYPAAVAVNHDGDVAVSDSGRVGVAIYSSRGELKFLLEGVTKSSSSLAISSDNKYIVEGMTEILCYDRQGNQVLQIPTFDLNSKPACPGSVAADKGGHVMAGFGCMYMRSIISIFTSNGRFVKNIHKEMPPPTDLAVTCKGELVLRPSYFPPNVMDLSGENIRYIHPPPAVNDLEPVYICCSHEYGETFLSYCGIDGQPGGIYRYTPDGEYIGLATDEVKAPRGMALTRDEQQLFAAERSHDHDDESGKIKVFQRS